MPHLALAIPILALLIPIVAILAHHQQKMAQIVQSGRDTRMLEHEIVKLRQEMQELRELVHQQLIALDDRRPPGLGGPES
jgi:hypothetical protein